MSEKSMILAKVIDFQWKKSTICLWIHTPHSIEKNSFSNPTSRLTINISIQNCFSWSMDKRKMKEKLGE